MDEAQIGKVYAAAVAIFGDGFTARTVKVLEIEYLWHLAAEGLPDTQAARERFSAGADARWRDSWTWARDDATAQAG